MNKISQAEARRLKRRVEELEREERRRRNVYLSVYPGGVNIAQSTFSSTDSFLPAVVRNSRLLGHAVVVVNEGAKLLYYAIPHREQKV